MEPLSMFLAVALLGAGVSWHVDSTQQKKSAEETKHYLLHHKEAYVSEAELKVKNREAERKAAAYRLRR